MLIGLIRHAPTAWNAAHRLQGRTDIPLSDEGINHAKNWHLPSDFPAVKFLTSPLIRAQQTARLLLGDDAAITIDQRLIEMDFGDWEGETLCDLRARDFEQVRAREDMGREFCAPNGETPNQVMARVCELCQIFAGREDFILGITHKAVIRAAMALATGWNMLGRAPWKLDYMAMHIFDYDAQNTEYPLRTVKFDVALDGAAHWQSIMHTSGVMRVRQLG